jgi:hypothetical protein
MKAYMGSWGTATHFYPWHSIQLGANIIAQLLKPWQNLGAHWTGGWVGPRSRLYAIQKKTFPALPGFEHHCSSPTLVHTLTTPCWMPIFWVLMYTIRFVYTSCYCQLPALHLIHPVF